MIDPFWRLRLAVDVGIEFCMIVLLDHGPERWRRSILSQEYDGEFLRP